MKQLLAPLQKLANIIEEQNQKVDKVIELIEIDLVKASKENSLELKAQTHILMDIKLLLEEQARKRDRSRSERGGRFNLRMPKLAGAATVGLAVISMAAALVVSAGLFMLMPVLNPMALLSALAVALAITVITPAFVKIAKALKGLKTPALIATSLAIPLIAMGITFAAGIFLRMSGITAEDAPDPLWSLKAGLSIILFAGAFRLILDGMKGMGLKEVALAATAIPLVAMGAVAAGLVFMLANKIDKWVAPPVDWSLQTGLAIALFSVPFATIIYAISKNITLKQIGFASLAIPLMAIAIVGTAYLFSLLGGIDGWVSPPVEWSMKTGLAMMVFAIPFVAIALAAKKIGFKGLLMATLAIPLISVGILAAAWIFTALPDSFNAPPLDWAIAAGIAITIFAIPLAVVGALATALTPVGLLLGAAGIILIAGTMWVVAWIFSKMPDLSAIAKNITDALMYPVNSMIDALARFKNEIGIENLLPLAGGLLAIAGSWLALTGALAGQAVGGLVSSVANLGKSLVDGISSFFGGEKTKSPIDLLDMLINRADGITKLADPVKTLGKNFAEMSRYTEAVITGVTAFAPFLDEDKAEAFTESANAADKLATAYEKMANASVKMDAEAINASARMFEALARVAEADGEDAISMLAKKLMAAVEELSETVENLQEANDKNSSSVQDTISSTIGGFIDRIKGVNKDTGRREEPGLVDSAGIILAIQELEDRLNRPIRVEEA